MCQAPVGDGVVRRCRYEPARACQSRHATSNLVPGQDVAALTLVPLGPDGTVTVRRSAATHVVVDVVGVVHR